MFMEVIMKREQFGSRLGFILVSAGCAIGLGNVWKFPYMAGKYGGGDLYFSLPAVSGHFGTSDHRM